MRAKFHQINQEIKNFPINHNPKINHNNLSHNLNLKQLTRFNLRNNKINQRNNNNSNNRKKAINNLNYLKLIIKIAKTKE